MRRKINLEVQQCLPQQHSLREPRPLFEAMILASCKCTESPAHVHMHAIIAIYSLLRATPINMLLLQKLYSCSMPGNIHVQQTYSLHETTSTYSCVCKLTGSHTYQSVEISFAYREYTLLGTCNALLTQFLSVFHSLPIRVISGSDPDCYPGQRVIRVSSCDPVSTLS